MDEFWFPLVEARFLRWRLSEDGAQSPVAYDNGAIVGWVASCPHSLRVGNTVYPVALYSGFTVDPSSRRVALPLIQRLRDENEKRGVAYGIGLVIDDPQSASYRFWTKYAESYPQNFRLVFNGGFWAKFLGPQTMARAGIEAWERMANRVLGPVLRFSPFKHHRDVRLYRPSDIDQCAELLARYTAQYDWAMAWQKDLLASQLQNDAYETLVLEQSGSVRAMVNYHFGSMYGRARVRTVIIDIWADDGLSSLERIRLLSYVCAHLMESGVDAVVAPRSAMMPAAAFVGNLFMPAPQNFMIGLFLTKHSAPLPPPKLWDLTIV